MNTHINNPNKCDLLKTYTQRQRLSNALKLLEGVSRLPLKNNPQRAAEIQQIYGLAKEREKE